VAVDPLRIGVIAGQQQGLIDTTQQSYGQLPNPQLAAEAQTSGAIPDVLQAATQQDPIYGSVIPAHPVTSGTGVDLLQSPPVTTTPYTFDWKSYQQQVKQNPSDNAGYGAIGGRPVASMGYLQGVEYWVSRDQKSAKSWQTFLHQQGFYDPKNPPKVTGQWSDADQEALEHYMVSLAIPEALYAQGQNSQMRRSSAAVMVQEVSKRWGQPISMSALQQEVQSNQGVREDVARSWLYTQADPLSQQGARLARYQELYGKDALSAAEQNFAQQVGSPGLLQQILDLPTDLVESPVKGVYSLFDDLLGGIEDRLPVIGSQMAKQRQQRAAAGEAMSAPQQAYTKLSAADQAALQPALQDASQDRSWLATGMDWFTNESNRLKLFMAYSTGDAIRDPFGTSSPSEIRRNWDQAGAHQGNVMQALLGPAWVQQHQTWAAVGETANNMVDPTLLLGPIGRFAEAGALGRDLEAASALSRDEQITKTVSVDALDRTNLALRPREALAAVQAKTLPRVLLNPSLSIPDRLRVMNAMQAPDRAEALTKFLHDDQGNLRPGLTEQDVLGHLQAEHAHVLTGSQGIFDFREQLRSLTPLVQKRMSAGKIQAAFLQGTFDAGGRHIDLLGDLPSAIEKMEMDAHVEGVPAEQITGWMNQMWMARGNPGKLVDVFNEFYDELSKNTEPEFHTWLDQQRGAAGNYAHGTVPRSLQRHVYAPDPHPEPGEAPKERSLGPRRLDNQVIDQVKSLRLARSQVTEAYQTAAGDWWETLRGHRPQTQQEWDQALGEFEAAGGNADVVGEYRDTIAKLEAAEKKAAPLGIERGVPMVPQQLSHLVVAPYSTMERVMWKHPVLRTVNTLVDKMRLDELQNIWKVWEVAKPSTLLRAAMGDDILRWSTHLMLQGSPDAAVNALAHSRLMANPAGKAFLRVAEPVMRSHLGKVVSVPLSGAINVLGSLGAGTVDALRGVVGKGVRDVTAERLGPQLGREVHGYLSAWRGHSDYQAVMPNEAGHRQAFEHALATTFNHEYVKGWARAYDQQGPAAAQDWLTSSLTDGSEEMNQLLSARGVGSVQSQVARNVTYHEQQAAAIGRQLQDLDAQKAPPAGYRSAYRALPKRGPVGQVEIPGVRGSYRDKVVARMEWHQAQAQVPAAIRATARNTHQYLTEMLSEPDFRKWVAQGRVEGDVLDQWYKDPSLRQKLPVVVASSDSLATRGMLSKAAMGIPQAFMNHVFSNFVKGARGRGAEAMRQWWRRQLDEVYPAGTSGVWTDEAKDREAIAQARQWIKDNTYQGTQRISDYALRNLFPFVGAANSMRRFFVSEMKLHPWLAGVLAKGAAGIEDHKDYGVFWNPLSMVGITGGDAMLFHPLNSLVATRDGIGSFIPGYGPIIAPFVAMASQDAGVRRVLSQIPGWGDYLPDPGGTPLDVASSAVGGAVPSTISQAVVGGAELAGISQSALPTGERLGIDETAQGDLARGEEPTPASAEQERGAQRLGGGALGWLLPITPTFEDQRGAEIREANAALPENPTAADYDKVYQQFPDVAPALRVFDPRTTIEQADQIRQQNPWVDAYTTSKYVDPTSPTTKPQVSDLSQFRDEVSSGDIQIAGVGDIDQRYQQGRESTAASMYYDTYVKAVKQAWLQANPGEGTSSTAYKQQVMPYVNQQMAILQERYPDWWAKFYGTGFGTQAEEANSAPISTLSALYDFPVDPGMETPRSQAMRQIVYARDLVASRIVELQNDGADQTSVDQVTQMFQQWLTQNYGNDPEVSPMLDLYHWSSWSDFLSVGEANVKQYQSLFQ
jgi:hypothetical protein